MCQLGQDLINYQCLNSDTISQTINFLTLTRSHKLSMSQLGHNLTNYQFLNSDLTNYQCLNSDRYIDILFHRRFSDGLVNEQFILEHNVDINYFFKSTNLNRNAKQSALKLWKPSIYYIYIYRYKYVYMYTIQDVLLFF